VGTENMNNFSRTLGSVVNIYVDLWRAKKEMTRAVQVFKMCLWFRFISQNKNLLSRMFALLF